MFVEKKLAPEWEYEEAGEGAGANGAGSGEGGEGGNSGGQNTPPALSDDTEIEVNGEKIKVGELKQGYLRQSDYTKKSQELADEKKKLEGAGKPKGEDGKTSKYSEEDLKTAEYLLTIAMEDPSLREKFGIVTKQELAQEKIVQKLSSDAEKLTKEFDGKNGLPKFDEEAVLTHMQKEGFRDMKKAYIDLHWDAYVEWKSKKGSSAYRTENRTTPPSPTKQKFDVRKPEEFAKSAASILEEIQTGKQE